MVAPLDSPVVCGFDCSERDAESSSLILRTRECFTGSS
jgi:hypothetical protein